MSTVKPQLRPGDLEEDPLHEELLPGIPNDITLNWISPKLSWRDFPVLSTVSPSWEQAIEGRLLYNARVNTNSVEMLAVVAQRGPEPRVQKLSLYSLRDDSWHELPSIPGLLNGFPSYCLCASLDGKLYVLGGWELFNGGYMNSSRKVYVLDLVGQRNWKQCASMRDPRMDFSGLGSCAGVINGKIYCFGGNADRRFAQKCEVYDPKADTWSRINPMIAIRLHHRVATMGRELLVQCGDVYKHPGGAALRESGHTLLEAYHPIKDEWRLVEPPADYSSGAMFIAGGKFHVITEFAIYVHDVGEHSRTLFQSCSFSGLGPAGSIRVEPVAALHIDDELLLLVHWNNDSQRIGSNGTCLLRSRGFGHKNNEIVWEKIKCSCCHEECPGCYNISCRGSILM